MKVSSSFTEQQSVVGDMSPGDIAWIPACNIFTGEAGHFLRAYNLLISLNDPVQTWQMSEPIQMINEAPCTILAKGSTITLTVGE